MNQNIKSNDSLDFLIETMNDMYISIFQWSPYEDTLSVNKIFPNKVDFENFFKQNTERATIWREFHYVCLFSLYYRTIYIESM